MCIFVQSKSLEPAGPIPVKIRDPKVWWPYKEIVKRIDRMNENYGSAVSIGCCGTTSEGRDIPFIAAGEGRDIIGLVGAVHAGESGPETNYSGN